MASSMLISVLIAGILIVLKCGVSSAHAPATGESKSNTASLLYQIIGDLSVVKHENNELAEKIEMLEGQFDHELEAEINGKLESRLESLQTEIEEKLEEKLESRLETLESTFETNLQSGIESLRTEVEGKLDSRMTSFESALEGKLESGLESLESALETKRQSELEALRTEVDGKLVSKLETFGSALEEKLETGLETLESTLETKRQSGLQTLESKLDGKRESLRSEVGSIGSELKSLQSELKNLKDQTPRPTWCSPPYKYHTLLKLCWRLETETKLSWSRARSTCFSEGGDLISLDTPQKVAYIQKSVADLTYRHNYVYVGANNMAGGKYMWVNGEPVQEIPWPGNRNTENDGDNRCIVLNRFDRLFYHTASTNIYGFLCQLN